VSNDPTKKPDDLIGKKFGQFEIIEEIGRGGMATVYRARQASMNRTVAIKVLPRQMLHDPGFYERFEREVDVIAHLEHPHILPIYDFGRAEDVPYIAMRYLGGGSLEQRLRRGILSLEELEKPLKQIAQALDYAHQQGIIHRDLKPGNIMLDENGNAYLSDFGIARVLGSDLTGSMIIGTPAYMSPEQANGLPIDGRSDIYSLGVVVFELLTGRGPFQAETPMAILLKHISEPLPSIRELRHDIPESVERVIRQATEKDPDARYSSASEFADAFSAAIANHDTDIMPSSKRPTARRQPDQSELPTQLEKQFPKTEVISPTAQISRRSWLPIILFGAIMLILITGGGVILLSELRDSPPPPPPDREPTPFPLADVIRQPQYSISIPRDWIPRNGDFFVDLSDERRMINAWYDPQGQTFVSLALMDLTTPFDEAVASYTQEYYSGREAVLQLIDEAIAEDGTIRRSYYVAGEGEVFADAPVPQTIGSLRIDEGARQLVRPGQLDVFFKQADGQLAVLEFYTADQIGNGNVGRLQLILDSLQLN